MCKSPDVPLQDESLGIGLPVDGGSQYRYREGQKLNWGHVT